MKTRSLYKTLGLPVLQNRLYSSEAEARSCPRGDIDLVEDLGNGLVHNQAFRPELMIYDETYNNEQNSSPTFRVHLDAVAQIIGQYIGREKLVEVGCGKGYFLEKLLSEGFDVSGIDPTYTGINARVRKEYFHSETNIAATGLILRHVLEHIPDPLAFLALLCDANGGAGKIYIEVPCFNWICARRTWFDIFYEHVNYFRMSDFKRMFGSVHYAAHSFGGQYLSIVADLGTLRPPRRDPTDTVTFPADFTDSVTGYADTDSKLAVWGGGSKGVIFSLFMERSGSRPAIVIDINEAKQGKYLPATGLQVVSPEQALESLERNSTIFVMNSNYLAEIREMTSNRFRYVTIDKEPVPDAVIKT